MEHARLTGTEAGRAFYVGLLEALTRVMGAAKGYLHDHGPRVAMLASGLGAEMGLDEVECSALVFAAVLSDMGMVGLAEDAWENPTPTLSDEVRERVEMHPRRSEERVGEIPHLQRLGPLIRHHHEWWNGRGYPDRLAGDAIPLGAQILRLADTVTALSGDRPQRKAMATETVLRVVEAGRGEEFGPDVVDAFLALQRCGEVRPFTHASYGETVHRAAEHLLPTEVSPLSTEQLLAIVANVIDAKDPYTGGHSRRVARLAAAVADQMKLDASLKAQLWAVGYLHDLGKVAVPLRVLTKTDRLDADEFALIRAHPSDGAAMLEEIPTLRHLASGVRFHHERWDGSGYPEGLSGDRIPLVSQVMAVCDAYDAMTSRRAYRDSLGPEYALDEVRREAGSHFGPLVAEAFLALPSAVFDEVKRAHPAVLSDVPARVQTLRRIDPRWFTGRPVRSG
jgi:HD-GYP domain-containing protein (c-di-GMP phosphodiesterase class II)